MLDRVVGPGNSSVQVTADLDFDKAVTETTRYFAQPGTPALSETASSEQYDSPNGSPVTGGVVGPDGQMDSPASLGESGAAQYTKESHTSDNAVNKSVEQREAAPGEVSSLHVGVVLDTRSVEGIDPGEVQSLVATSLGIKEKRGDTVEVTTLPFDRTAEAAATKELAAAAAADKRAEQMTLLRNGGLILLIALLLVVAWLKSRKRNKARDTATHYMVEQLRRDAADRAAAQVAFEMPSAATIALESSEGNSVTREIRDEIAAMVERQPEDVAQLLRGWLVDRV
jgi:flagellar M-ring protein FliF